MTNWIKNLLCGDERVVNNAEHTMDDKVAADLNINTLYKSVIESAAIAKTANITSLVDASRERHAAGLSDSNLASALTELGLADAEKSVMLEYRDEYPKMLELVKKNRKKAEEKLLKYIPFHNMKKKASADGAEPIEKTAYPNVWSVMSNDGIDTIMKMIADPYESSASPADVSFSLLSSIGVIHNGDNVEIKSNSDLFEFQNAQVVGLDATASDGKFLMVKVAFADDVKGLIFRMLEMLDERFNLNLSSKNLSIHYADLPNTNEGSVEIDRDVYEVMVNVRNSSAVISLINAITGEEYTETYRFQVPDLYLHSQNDGENLITIGQVEQIAEQALPVERDARKIAISDIIRVVAKPEPVKELDFKSVKLTDEERKIVSGIVKGNGISVIAAELGLNIGSVFLSLESDIKSKFNKIAGKKLSHLEFVKAANEVDKELEAFTGDVQHTDDLSQQVPGVYRDIAQDFCKNTKDFGEFQSVNKSYPDTEATKTAAKEELNPEDVEVPADQDEIEKFERNFSHAEMLKAVKELEGDAKLLYDAMIAENGHWPVAVTKLNWPMNRLGKARRALTDFFKEKGIEAGLNGQVKTAADAKIEEPEEAKDETKTDVHDSSGAKVGEIPAMGAKTVYYNLDKVKEYNKNKIVADHAEMKSESPEGVTGVCEDGKQVQVKTEDVVSIDASLTKSAVEGSFSADELTEAFEFLDALRESGATNMYGAGAYVEQHLGHDKTKSRKILSLWMKTFGGGDKPAADRAKDAMEKTSAQTLQITEPFTGKVRTFTIEAASESELEVTEEYSDDKLKVPVTEDEDELKAFISRAIINKVAEVTTQYAPIEPGQPVKKPEDLKILPQQQDAPAEVTDKDGKVYKKQIVQND